MPFTKGLLTGTGAMHYQPLSLCSLVTFQTLHLQIAVCNVEHSPQCFLPTQDQSAKQGGLQASQKTYRFPDK